MPGPLAGEPPVAHDLAPVDQDVVDAVRLGVQPPGAAGEIEAHGDVVAAHRLRIDDDEVGEPPFGDAATTDQAVQAGLHVGDQMDGLLEAAGADAGARPCPTARWRS